VPLLPLEKLKRRPGRFAGDSVPDAFFEPLPAAETGGAAGIDSADPLLAPTAKP
jgi:hypothetical protein